MGIINKITDRFTKTEEEKEQDGRLARWRDLHSLSRTAYEPELENLREYRELYNNTRSVRENVNISGGGKQGGQISNKETNIRYSLSYEMINSQIDNQIPIPKIEEDTNSQPMISELAIDYVKSQKSRMKLNAINDTEERIRKIYGSAFWLFEYDYSKQRANKEKGDTVITILTPEQVIPQQGAVSLEDSDYIFIEMTQTKEYIFNRYGKKVYGTEEFPKDDSELNVFNEEMVTHILCYYKNDEGGIGLFSWVQNTVIEDVFDCQCRKVNICTKCGKQMIKKCECGCTTSKLEEKVKEKITQEQITGQLTPTIQKDEQGMPLIDEQNRQVLVNMPITLQAGDEVEYYKITQFPIINSINVSRHNYLVGESEVEKIKDFHYAINRNLNIIDEKLMTAQVYVVIRSKNKKLYKQVFKSVRDEAYAIIDANVDDTVQVQEVKASIEGELNAIELYIDKAKKTLGITDTWQGLRDTTATSGVAKEIQTQNTAGRLQSKIEMKNVTYVQIYTLVYKFFLAYSDELRTVRRDGLKDSMNVFDRYMCLLKDCDGEWYYYDDIEFAIDASGYLKKNQQQQWALILQDYQAGIYGDPTNPEVRKIVLKLRKETDYPLSNKAYNLCLEQMDEEKNGVMAQMQQQIEQMTMQLEQTQSELSQRQQNEQQLDQKNKQLENELKGEEKRTNDTVSREIAKIATQGRPSKLENSEVVQKPVMEKPATTLQEDEEV